MGLFKQLTIYTLILLGLVFAAGSILATYLLFVPDSEILGYYYVSGSRQTSSTQYTFGIQEEYEHLVIESNKFDIQLTKHSTPEHSDRFDLDFYSIANGFARAGGREFTYELDYDSVSKTLTISTIEPYGGPILYNSTKLKVAMPQLQHQPNSLTIISNGGKVSFGSNFSQAAMSFENVNIENTRARIDFHNTEITEELSIENVSGRVRIRSDIQGDVKIMSEISSFNFRDNDGNMTDIHGSLEIGQGHSKRVKNVAVQVGDIFEALDYFADDGLLDVGNIGNNFFARTNTSEIDVLSVANGIDIDSNYNDINLGTIGVEGVPSSSVANIKLSNGSIYINESFMDVLVNSARGSVNIVKQHKDVDITTTYGNITVAFADSVSENVKMDATTTQGNITVTNIVGEVNLQVSRNSDLGKITAEFVNINSDSTIRAGRKGADISIPIETGDNYLLQVYTSGQLDVHTALGSGTLETSSEEFDEGTYNGEYGYEVGSPPENTLQIRSHGSVDIDRSD